MPRPERRRGLQRLDQRGTRIRPRSVPDALGADVATSEQPSGLIILPVTAAMSASSDGLCRVAAGLQDRGFATFLAELLSPAEAEHGYHNFDFEMLASRIAKVTE